MIQRTTRGRTLRAAAGTAAVAAALASAGPAFAGQSSAAAPSSPAPVAVAPATGSDMQIKSHLPAETLGAKDEQKLAERVAANKPWTTILVTTEKGKTDAVAASIKAAGGYVRYESAQLRYLSAYVPTSSVQKTASLPTVRAVDLDEVVQIPTTKPDSLAGARAAAAAPSAPGAGTPDDNPYMPTRETGSITFKQDHPTWDGRGTTIGILDSGVDLGHPSLTTTSTGERKISDWFTATDPVTEGSLVSGGDATWLPMITSVSGPTATIGKAVYQLPAGTFKGSQLVEAATKLDGCELCGDLNRDGDTTDRFGVLYDPVSHKVWLDTDDDKSFLDETAMLPYRSNHQVGELGRDKPATAIRESVPFTVDYRTGLSLAPLGSPLVVDFVDIGLASGEHGSHVAGIAAGHSFFGGAMDGQAPGAKLVSARACSFGAGCTNAALTDGMVQLALDGVDIINMSIGGLPALNDGDNARSELYNAIINELGVQIVISAGNSSNALNTIGDPAVATDVVAVGATISKETWKSNYNSEVRFDRGMMPFSSGGPREDGGFKPDLTAPGAAIASINTWLPGSPVAESGYTLPPGYAMLQGTSMASPQAAGSMALLIGAAKATNRPLTPSLLRYAVYSTTAFQEGTPAFLQGRGQIDVPEAWAAIKGSRYTTQAFTVSAPTCTAVWQDLGQLDATGYRSGPGLYNRCEAGKGGQAPGESKTYPVVITRTAGPAGAVYTKLSFTGDDGTYSVTPKKLNLELNTPVTVQVTAKPTAGAHSAILQVDDPATRGYDGQALAVVVAGTAPAAPSYAWSTSGTSYRNEAQRYYVTVPAGVKAMDVKLGGLAAGSQTRFLAFHPYGVPIDPTSTPSCYPNYGDGSGNGCAPLRRVYTDPTPGVWELLIESRRTSPLLANPFTLDVSLLGATVTAVTPTIASVVKGQPTPVTFTARNDFAPVTVHAEGGPLGSSSRSTPTIAENGVLTYTVNVPAGSTRFDVAIGGTSDPSADLDLYVTGPGGAKQSADGDSEEAVSYTAPPAGVYTVEIDGYAVPSGSTTFSYSDAFFSPALGTLTAPSAATLLSQGQTLTVPAVLTANAAPETGRTLSGRLQIVSDTGAVLGSAGVVVEAVTG